TAVCEDRSDAADDGHPRCGARHPTRAASRARPAEGLTGYVLFDQHYIRYFTSFGFLATERPVAFVQSETAEMAVFVRESRSSAASGARSSRVSTRARSAASGIRTPS